MNPRQGVVAYRIVQIGETPVRLCRRVRKKWSIRISSATTIRASRRCPPGRVLDGIPPVLVMMVIKVDRDAGRENERRFAVGGEPELGVPGPVVHDHRRVVGDHPHYSLSQQQQQHKVIFLQRVFLCGTF